MRHFPLYAMVLFCFLDSPGRGENYTNFSSLPEKQKSKIIWDIYDKNQWGNPDQKPICREILTTQTPNEANQNMYVDGAINLTEKQGWVEFRPLIEALYQKPLTPWINQRAYEYLCSANGKPVPPEVRDDAEIITNAGYYQSAVSHSELRLAIERLAAQPEQKAVIANMITVYMTSPGKGGTQRGHEAALVVLKLLPQNLVDIEIDKCCKSFESMFEENERINLLRIKLQQVRRW